MSPALRSALTDPDAVTTRALPADVARLLERLEAPPRLAAHLRIVHDVACQLTDALADRHPELAVDRAAVRFGAATHDVGKVVHVEEISGPGSAHEPAGYEILLAEGIPERLARFARTHGDWSAPGLTIEDHLVSVADKVWKGKRVTDLEDLVVGRLAEAMRAEPWQAFLHLDEILDRLAGDAERRLAFQSDYPVSY